MKHVMGLSPMKRAVQKYLGGQVRAKIKKRQNANSNDVSS
jgi:hypothetical protein